jgi:hypothetical protein
MPWPWDCHVRLRQDNTGPAMGRQIQRHFFRVFQAMVSQPTNAEDYQPSNTRIIFLWTTVWSDSSLGLT